MERLRGEKLDKLGDLNRKFTPFVMQPDEKVCSRYPNHVHRLVGVVHTYYQCIVLLNVLIGQTQMTVKRRKATQCELHMKQVSLDCNRYRIDIQHERTEIQ